MEELEALPARHSPLRNSPERYQNSSFQHSELKNIISSVKAPDESLLPESVPRWNKSDETA